MAGRKKTKVEVVVDNQTEHQETKKQDNELVSWFRQRKNQLKIWRMVNVLLIWLTMVCRVTGKVMNNTVIGAIFINRFGVNITINVLVLAVMVILGMSGTQPKNDEKRLPWQWWIIGVCAAPLMLFFGAGFGTALWVGVLAISVYWEYLETDKNGKRTPHKRKRKEFRPTEDGGFTFDEYDV